MDRFEKIKDYLGSLNRNVWLVVGLIVVAGLIAVAVIYGNVDDITNQANGDEANQEQPIAGDVNNEDAASPRENDEVTEQDEDAVLPAELADTGSAAPLAVISLLGATGYLYHQSRKHINQAQQQK